MTKIDAVTSVKVLVCPGSRSEVWLDLKTPSGHAYGCHYFIERVIKLESGLCNVTLVKQSKSVTEDPRTSKCHRKITMTLDVIRHKVTLKQVLEILAAGRFDPRSIQKAIEVLTPTKVSL